MKEMMVPDVSAKPWRKRTERRRYNDAKKHDELVRKARVNRGPLGPYIDKSSGLVKIAERGKQSRYYKKRSNRKVRRTAEAGRYCTYKKLFDYKLEII